MKTIFTLLSIFITYQANAQTNDSPVTTVKSIDLKQYLGTWFEIAAIPQYFEKKCIGNVTAEYSIAPNELISVVNSCDTLKGRSIANGRARVVDRTSNSKLEVTFVHFLGWQFMFGGDYWILAIGDNYSYAVIGAPNRKYAWILSRTPNMPQSLLVEASQALINQGFDTCKLISTSQKGGLQEKTPVCDLLKAK